MLPKILYDKKCSIYGKAGKNGRGQTVKGDLIVENLDCRLQRKEVKEYTSDGAIVIEKKTIIYFDMLEKTKTIEYDYIIKVDDIEYKIMDVKTNTSVYKQFNHYKIEVLKNG